MSNTAHRLLLLVALCCALFSIAISSAHAGEADDEFAVAAGHYSAKRWDLAVGEFRQFLHDYPDHAKHGKAMFFEGEALVQLGRNAEAYPLFVDLLAEEPAGAYARLTLFGAAEAAVLSGQNGEAQVRLLQFQSQYPADKLNANVLMYRGELSLRSGNIMEAEHFYRKSLEQFADQPSADECRLNLAHVLEEQKQSEAADNMLHEVAQHDHSPWSEMALLQLAAKQLAAKKPQAALEQYEAVEKRFPTSPLLPQTHLGCGRALFQLGHYAEAEGVLAPLAEDKQIGADARYWILMSQKAQQQFAATETLRPELESSSLKANKSALAGNPSGLNNSASVATPQNSQGSMKSIKSIFSSRPDSSVGSQPQQHSSALAASDKTSNNSGVAQSSPDNTAANSTALPVAASPQSKPILQQLESPIAAAALEEQSRRRSAMIRYQAADAMIRAGQFDRAIGMLQIGDNSGDDPHSLANRYLLSIALQDAKRNDEALQTLDDLSAVLQTKLAADSTPAKTPHLAPHTATNRDGTEAAPSLVILSPAAPSQTAISQVAPAPNNHVLSPQDRAALKTLNDNVQLARATSLLLREKYAEAIVPLQIYLSTPRQDSGAERARSALAISLANVGRASEAQQALADLKSNHPGSDLILNTTDHVAEAAYAAGQYDAAAPLFAELAADGNPPNIVAKGLSGVAWCHFQAGQDAAADQAFAKFLEKFPADPRAAEAALDRGQLLEREGQEDAAAQLYSQAIKRYAQSKQLPQLLLAAAKQYDRLQRPEDAAPLYQHLALDFPTYHDIDAVLYSWAWSLRDLGRGADADKVFRMLYEDHPKSRFWADAAYRLAERATQQSDRETADSLLKQLTSHDCPPAVLQHALYLQGQIAINQEQWNAAEAPLTRLVQHYPDCSLRMAAEFWLAEIAYRSGDYVLADQRFEALAPRVTDHSEAWTGIVPLRRAQMLAQQKQWIAARTLAESIAHDFPQFTQKYEADYLIGRCLAADADFDGARAAFEKVVHSAAGGKTETAAMAQWMIGESYFHQDNFAAALREYLLVEVVYPYPRWQAASLLQAAKCYQRLGQPQEASQLYAKVLQNYPQTEFVAEASQRLNETTRK